MVGSDIEQKGEVQNFGHEWGEPSLVEIVIPPQKKILRSVLDLIIVTILKNVREKEQIYSM